MHGGLRYLASGAVGIAHESAVERGILMTRTAPHLVRALPQVVPLLPGASRRARRRWCGSDFAAGDVLRAARARPPRRAAAVPDGPARPRRCATTRRACAPTGLRGGLLAWDGQLVDDARLVVAIARTAAALGARILTRCAAEQVTGRGAVLRDDAHRRARSTSTPAWSSTPPACGPAASRRTITPAARAAAPTWSCRRARSAGCRPRLTVPVPGDDQPVRVRAARAGRRVYVGLTDEDAPGEIPDVPQPDRGRDRLPARHDQHGAARAADPRRPARHLRRPAPPARHAAATAPRTSRAGTPCSPRRDGLVTVVGGKLTTYRRMAEDALDAALRSAGLPARPCVTDRLPLVGAAVVPTSPGSPRRRGWCARYGTEAPDVVAAAAGDPALLEPGRRRRWTPPPPSSGSR